MRNYSIEEDGWFTKELAAAESSENAAKRPRIFTDEQEKAASLRKIYYANDEFWQLRYINMNSDI